MDESQPVELVRRALTSTRAISTLGVAIWVPLGMLRFFLRQTPTRGLPIGATAGLVLVSGATALLGAWLVKRTILRHQTGYRASIARTFAAYVALLVIVWLGQLAGGVVFSVENHPSVLRLVGSLALLYLISAILGYFDSYRERLSLLLQEQQRLVELRTATALRLQSLRAQVVEAVWTAVSVSWSAVVAQLVAARKEADSAQQFRAISAKVRSELIQPIRQLSYQVQETEAFETSPTAAQHSEHLTLHEFLPWREVLAAVPTTRPFRPVAVAATVAFLSLINLEFLNLSYTLLSIVLLTAISYILLWIADHLLAPTMRSLSKAQQWSVLITAVIVISCVVAIASWWVLTLDHNPYPRAIIGGPILCAVVISIWATLAAASAKAEEVNVQLGQALELRKQETVALQREVESGRQELANTLHGDVQTLLTSAAFRLALAADEIEDQAGVLGPTRAAAAVDDALDTMTVARARIDEIGRSDANSSQSSNVLEQVNELGHAWTGIAEVTTRIEPSAALAIDARVNGASLTPIVVEIVKEAILNAVRHAHAAHVWIDIDATKSLCRITVANDGAAPPATISSGFGYTMLDQFDCDWSLVPGGSSGGVLHVELSLLQ